MEPEFVDLYAKAFTDDQLDAITAFYKSAAGVVFLEKTVDINAQSPATHADLQDILHAQPQLTPLHSRTSAKSLAAPPAPGASPRAAGSNCQNSLTAGPPSVR